MQRPIDSLWASALLACLFLFALSPEQAVAAPSAQAVVIAERGEVQFQRSGTAPFLALGFQASLYPGDTVRTGPGGKVALLFSDGSQIKLNGNSRLTLPGSGSSPPEENLFQAIVGVFWAHLRPGSRFQTGPAIPPMLWCGKRKSWWPSPMTEPRR